MSETDKNINHPAEQLFGRRKGKPLRPGRKALVAQELQNVRIDQATLKIPCQPQQLFVQPPKAVWLEIGFGGGEHLAAQAKTHPEIGFIGAEIFLNGIASLLSHRKASGINNIRIVDNDAREFLPLLADHSLDRVFLLYPDPWPKSRHAKRRFICLNSLNTLARVMSPGAELRIVTDHALYARWCLRHGPIHPAFRWSISSSNDWKQPPPDSHTTRYEQKAIREGRSPIYLNFVRLAR